MKKLTLGLATVLLFLTFFPTQLLAGTEDPTKKPLTETVESSEADILLARLNEINELDKSNLSSSEKRDLRKEVREIKSTLMLNSGGIYLSVGALIVVILLLILLL